MLGIFVALVDLLPVIGSAIAGVMCLVALSVSLPICLATIGFFVVYRLAESYLIMTWIIGQAVQVPAVLTVVAALLGGPSRESWGHSSPSPPPQPCCS